MKQITKNPPKHRGEMMQSVSSFGASRTMQTVLATVAALVVATATLFGLGMTKEAGAQASYVVKGLIDIDPVSGDSESFGEDVNDAGQVVGDSEYDYYDETTQNNVYKTHAFLYENNITTDLGRLSDGNEERGAANGVNVSGDVAGSSLAPDGENIKAFLYKDGSMQGLESLDQDPNTSGSDPESEADDINDAGQVVGTSVIPCYYKEDNPYDDPDGSDPWCVDDKNQAVLWENDGSPKDIGAIAEREFPGTTDSTAHAINNQGQVVGMAIDQAGYDSSPVPPYKAWLYDSANGSVKDLGGNGSGNTPRDINAKGDVVGDSYYQRDADGNSPSKVFLHKGGGTTTELPAVPDYFGVYAGGLNDTGQIVGYAETPEICDEQDVCTDEKATAVLYNNGQWTDLNTLISSDPAYEGWHLKNAKAITNDAQNQVKIAGSVDIPKLDEGKPVLDWEGNPESETRAYLLTLDLGSASSGDESVTTSVTASGPPATTDAENDGATAADPVETSVGGVNGDVTITEKTSVDQSIDQSISSGYSLFDGQQVDITAPAGTVDSPLAITFTIDSTLAQQNGLALPDDINSLVVFRNGTAVSQECLGATKALADNPDGTPNPCVSKRVWDKTKGDAVITVLTTKASKWNLGKPKPYSFKGFSQPVDNAPTFNKVKAGSAVPVKFSLGGDRGLNIFAANYPKSQQVKAGSQIATDTIEQTTTATSGNNLSYDAASGQYTYVFKTDKSWANTDRELVLKFNDGSEQKVANFRFTTK